MNKCDNRCSSFPHEHIDGDHLVRSYIDKINKDSKTWNKSGMNVPWFRGQHDAKQSPLPAIFRKEKSKDNGKANKKWKYDEFWLTTTFRNRASTFGETPDREDIDKWLFLMQHVGAPTRLLDWTESALAALYFAVNDETKDTNPAVWMINPVALNHISLGINVNLGKEMLDDSNYDIFPNTWTPGSKSFENIRLAFHQNNEWKNICASEKPIAIQLTYCHPRMSAQKGCFTVHGTDDRGFEEIFDKDSKLVTENYLKKYVIDRKKVSQTYKELKTLGITPSSIFPDLGGLAKELEERFWNEE
ncbi:MAG: FRG domain-containing protein [Nitrospirae bacterium]|nr:FRG domain-containing protein [Nitrospirota bacterium]